MASIMTYDAWKAARAARDTGIASAEYVAEQFEAGYCYLRLIVPVMRLAVVKVVGAWPSLSALMALPIGLFCPLGELLQERCALVGSNELHVGRGGIALQSVVAHAALDGRAEPGTFGSAWAPRYSGLLLEVEEVCSLLVGGDQVSGGQCANGLTTSVSGWADDVVGLPVGYCYAQMVHSDCAMLAMNYLGPNPDLRSLLAMPARIFDVGELSMGVDVADGGGVMHVCDGGRYTFHSLALAAVRNSVGYMPAGSLGQYLQQNPVSIVEIGVRYDWIVGILSPAAGLLAAELSRLSGLETSLFVDADIEVACKTAALLDSGGKARLRILEAVGDNALSMLIVQRCAQERRVVQEYQEARSALAGNVHLGELFVGNGLDRFVQFVAGVARDGKVGGGCFEVMIGIVYNAGSMSAVDVMCRKLGFYRSYSVWADG